LQYSTDAAAISAEPVPKFNPKSGSVPTSWHFGDDTLGYFTERLDPAVTRRAAVTAVRQAKRHKAFDHCRFIGLALDGTGAGRSREKFVISVVPTATSKGRSSATTPSSS
jgi:hypothetical protein